MKNKQTYAVVDLETTGTDPLVDRIIQFGCVLIQEGKIISRFATDINPNQAISKQIQQLTGISNSRVQKAPYFEDVALTIYNLLADTVFVAHNIYFDYSFLTQELLRCGTPKLKIPGIDTVELAQIFLPTEKSFRLGDLSESLGLIHDNPHQADSDAQVTAELLLLIEAKMRRLPLITMEAIDRLSQQTGMDTSSYIHHIYEEMKQDIQPLAVEQHVVSGIALRRKEVPLYEEKLYGKPSFPQKKKAKEKIFADKISYRSEQSRMMNLVYDHFTKDENKNLFIEAATGTGKTLGYLFPLSYLATPDNPVIISTVSIVLQNQLTEKDIPLANQLCPKPIQAVIIKSHRHYIDLQRFKATLKNPIQQKQYALYQMGVLVWLVETETGDLDELQLTNFNHIFWRDVAHRGIDFLSDQDSLYQEDFVRFLYKKVKQSNVLIVNHAFLAQETLREVPLLPKSSYLIIDEAHHLPDIAGKIANRQFNYAAFKKQANLYLEEDQLFDQVNQIFKSETQEQRLLRIYSKALNDLVEEFSDLFYEISQLFKNDKQPNLEATLLTKPIFDHLSLNGETSIQKIEILLTEMQEIQNRLRQSIVDELEKYTASERIIFVSLLQFFERIEFLYECFDIYVNEWHPRWIKEYSTTPQGYGLLAINDLEASILPETIWYDRYQRILYTGGTLKFGNDKKYLPNKLGLSDALFKTLPDPYDYEQNARLYIPTEAIAISQANAAEFSAYIASVIQELSQEQDRSILVLFTSHEILSSVYYRLHPQYLNEGRELLAQGISGSREKILKRFAHSKNSILLGADSFWEGVDLPGEALSLLIVTRLPFENPKRPFVKARYDYLEEKGINPFTHEALPKAALRLRQALGRLIRSDGDKGALVVLDRRLVTAKYGKRMLKALPKDLVVKEESIVEITSELKEFLNK
ncbi:exonuclease, DNA polymerase III, epsilon subunit [Enterococcus haemoperoxidus ATCC BAA-382]|uniref:3'-5' exonuclease DinG n=1 Tax=Enterococcus haemoperoxidus ATCC BAA-382 TaxID=1158608 RepID=R2QSR3_9ENTE|nr:helicase C-terminal domain-containing protein [Enterococcus haemoperoxidus]EOH99557.1 exonuclease, DNA polymerase III, epsilon subunit [Enterococcus haemoperoxidus ATCC BAA-382]EOT62703.1 DNA polymerase III, epsilon subunit/ATP-dependent helicase DinG [Enterococcus haemoperoxidus ATCC BAA-382]OJG55170.1 exonuclease, DNA polymerase III, epsilon subunit [Enterococcus haemoperoxidus]